MTVAAGGTQIEDSVPSPIDLPASDRVQSEPMQTLSQSTRKGAQISVDFTSLLAIEVYPPIGEAPTNTSPQDTGAIGLKCVSLLITLVCGGFSPNKSPSFQT